MWKRIVEEKSRRPQGEFFCVSGEQNTSCGILECKLQPEPLSSQPWRLQPREYRLAIFQHTSGKSSQLIFEDCSAKDNPDENLCAVLSAYLNCASLRIAQLLIWTWQ